MAEGARLESVYTATYRGFESLSHRHHKKTALVAVFCYLVFCAASNAFWYGTFQSLSCFVSSDLSVSEEEGSSPTCKPNGLNTLLRTSVL